MTEDNNNTQRSTQLPSSVSTLLRAVPELEYKKISESAASFILERATQLTWLDYGAFKAVVDLGNGNVARVFRWRSTTADYSNDPNAAKSIFELPCEVHIFDDLVVEIMPKLNNITYKDSVHLNSVLQEHGYLWIDGSQYNAGQMTDGSNRLMIYDGIVSRSSLDEVRMYSASNSLENEMYRIAVIGKDPKKNPHSIWLFRETKKRTTPDKSTWVLDQSMAKYFGVTPANTGVWLIRKPLNTFDSHTLTWGQLRALAGTKQPIVLSVEKNEKTLG